MPHFLHMIDPAHPKPTRLRKLCLSLSETSEADSWRHPNFRAGKAASYYHTSRGFKMGGLPVPTEA